MFRLILFIFSLDLELYCSKRSLNDVLIRELSFINKGQYGNSESISCCFVGDVVFVNNYLNIIFQIDCY